MRTEEQRATAEVVFGLWALLWTAIVAGLLYVAQAETEGFAFPAVVAVVGAVGGSIIGGRIATRLGVTRRLRR
jgi:uncharacterized membrane protein YfcA